MKRLTHLVTNIVLISSLVFLLSCTLVASSGCAERGGNTTQSDCRHKDQWH